MRALFFLAVFATATITLGAVRAFPNGAPWGSANPAAEQNCASCHFGAEPIIDSTALLIKGLPQQLLPGGVYELEVILKDVNAATAGFQLFAFSVDGPAGTVVSSEAGVEFIGAAIRSTVPIQEDAGFSWTLQWRTMQVISSPIIFYVAANAANDDASPFGDTIHFRSYKLLTEQQ